MTDAMQQQPQQDFGGFLTGLGAEPPGTENRWKRFMAQPENLLTGLVLAGALASGASAPRAGAATLAFRGTLENEKQRMADERQQTEFAQEQETTRTAEIQNRTKLEGQRVGLEQERNQIAREQMQLSGLQAAGENALRIQSEANTQAYRSQDLAARHQQLLIGAQAKALELALKAPRAMTPQEYLNIQVKSYTDLFGEAPPPEVFQSMGAGYQNYAATFALLTTNPEYGAYLQIDPNTRGLYVQMPGTSGVGGAPTSSVTPGQPQPGVVPSEDVTARDVGTVRARPGAYSGPMAASPPTSEAVAARANRLLNKSSFTTSDVKEVGEILSQLPEGLGGNKVAERLRKKLKETPREKTPEQLGPRGFGRNQ